MRRNNPHIYEINLMTWLCELSKKEERAFGLCDIPMRQWETLKGQGMDAVWLMGIWERSPFSEREARNGEALREECKKILEDFQLDDLGGSPYAIRAYRPEHRFGTLDDLAKLRKKLSKIGMGLILDFVPNHTACDHIWISQRPYYYINSIPEAASTCPEGFFLPSSAKDPICIAHGRDPYFPPWTDTAQLDYSKRDTHKAMVETLKKIGRYCDGVRCDMAMLVLNEVFRSTWSQFVDKQETQEFWPYAIQTLKSANEDFSFIAEVYWGMGKRLLEAGFDYVYDKDFYDALSDGDVNRLRRQLSEPVPDQERMLRFLENHDEPRAMEVFGPERIRAAMVIHATVPGAKLYHQGQFEGRKLRVPVQLKRAPEEPVNRGICEFCNRLMAEVNRPVYRWGMWLFCAVDGWLDNHSCTNLLAWSLQLKQEKRIIVVNFSPVSSQGRIRLPLNWLHGDCVMRFVDIFKGQKYSYEMKEIRKNGLYVALDAWDFHFFILHCD